MTAPFPSRRSVHGKEGKEEEPKPPQRKSLKEKSRKAKDPTEPRRASRSPAKAKSGDGMFSNSVRESRDASWGFVQWLSAKVSGVSRAGARAWALGIAIAGIVVFTGLLTAGLIAAQSSGPRPMTVPGVLDSVEVRGRWGKVPVVVVSSPVEISSTKLRVEKTGSGAQLVEGQPVILSITAFDGETGELLNPDGQPNMLISSLEEAELGPTLSSLLVDKTEGSRLSIARPLTDGGVEVDVVDIWPTTASGEPCDEGGPLVVAVDGGGPMVKEKPGTAPQDLVVQCLLRGEGSQVGPEDDVILHYLAGNWEESKVTSSTWIDGMPTKVNVGEVMEGLSRALVDWRVGSRLALIIPPDMASGEDTVFAIVDILAVVPNSDPDSQSTDKGE